MGEKLPQSFYTRQDVIKISKELLGKKLCTRLNKGELTSGIITETEAYAGATDKASHAFNNRYTNRTRVMYEKGGVAYIYLCYGIHHLFNVITNQEGISHAILVRAIEPVHGIKLMMARRNKKEMKPSLTNGPGSLSQALGITSSLSGISLLSHRIWIEDTDYDIPGNKIIAGKRVGIAYAEEDAEKPWRFRIKDNQWRGK